MNTIDEISEAVLKKYEECYVAYDSPSSRYIVFPLEFNEIRRKVNSLTFRFSDHFPIEFKPSQINIIEIANTDTIIYVGKNNRTIWNLTKEETLQVIKDTLSKHNIKPTESKN